MVLLGHCLWSQVKPVTTDPVHGMNDHQVVTRSYLVFKTPNSLKLDKHSLRDLVLIFINALKPFGTLRVDLLVSVENWPFDLLGSQKLWTVR